MLAKLSRYSEPFMQTSSISCTEDVFAASCFTAIRFRSEAHTAAVLTKAAYDALVLGRISAAAARTSMSGWRRRGLQLNMAKSRQYAWRSRPLGKTSGGKL